MRHYTILYHVLKSITGFFAKISVLILIIAIIFSFVSIKDVVTGVITPFRMYLSIVYSIGTILLGLFLFFAVQYSFHSLMKAYKNNIAYLLREIYERRIFKYVFASSDERRKIYMQGDVIEKAIGFNEKLKTWPFSMDQLLQVLGSIIALIETMIVQIIIVFL